MKVLNTESNSSFYFMKRNINKPQKRKPEHLILNDPVFISLINILNVSIKEYYKVSRNNIAEANSFLSFYEEKRKLFNP